MGLSGCLIKMFRDKQVIHKCRFHGLIGLSLLKAVSNFID